MNKITTRQDLLYLLAQASELEHSLTCQYLYAAWSLKERGEPEVTNEQARVIDTWRQTLTGIAVQEMLHLGLASNLLSAIGGAPYLRRANFPQARTYTTLSLDFRLAGFGEKTLRRFACFELPPEVAPDSPYRNWPVQGRDPINWVETCSQVRAGRVALLAEPKPLLPGNFAYTSIGELYNLIKEGYETLYPEDASRLFIGSTSAQTNEMWHPMMAIGTRDAAAKAIDLILKQGEGAYGNFAEIQKAHFGRFVATFTELAEGTGGPSPFWNVIENPVLTDHPDISMMVAGEVVKPTLVTSDVARAANEIFVASYELALQVLMRYFARTDESEEQRYVLKQVALSLMKYCLTPLGTAIARLPAFAGQNDGPRAGASFEFYTDTTLLPHMRSSWLYFAERLEELSASSTALASSPLSANYPILRRALTGEAGNATHPGIVSVFERYALGLRNGLRAPSEWTWEGGIRAFFSPLDIERMSNHFDLDKEAEVRANGEAISRRIKPEGQNVTMPPQFLLEDPEAWSGYVNPEGTWTAERIATFDSWLGIEPGGGSGDFVCPDQPTWEGAVKSWFTSTDVNCMKGFGIDLSSYDSVKQNARDIERRLRDESMPPGRPWPQAQVDCFKRWMDAGFPRGNVTVPLTWRPTTAPRATRYDDIYFLDPEIGWAVNSNGHILHTGDGGDNWTRQFATPLVNDRPIYLRCIQFANAQRGFAGSVSEEQRLYSTEDGGATWTAVGELPQDAPVKVCGMTVVDENVIYCSGTNEPTDLAAMMKSVDGGKAWTAWSMEEHASILIDNHFFDAQRGLVVGGKTDVPHGQRKRSDVQPVILLTENGGATWRNLLKDFTSHYPKGEWGWKIFVVDANVFYVSLENFTEGAVAKTSDGGATWERLPINDPQGNANLEGVGFIDAERGWVGGWGDATFQGGYTSATTDGGKTWTDANEVGKFINRFRFFGHPVTVGYASGDRIYKYSTAPVEESLRAVAAIDSAPQKRMLTTHEPEAVAIPLPISFEVPEGTQRVTIHIWNQFAIRVRTLLDESEPEAGKRVVVWDGRDDDGNLQPHGVFIYRLTADDEAESRVIRIGPN